MIVKRFPIEGLSADYGDIILESVTENVDVKISISGVVVHHEIYTPDSFGMVYIRDFGSLSVDFFPLFDISLIPGIDGQYLPIDVSLSEGAQEISKTVEMYRCDAETAGTLTLETLIKSPLSRTDFKFTSIGRKEFISFYGGSSVYVDVVFAGTTKDERIKKLIPIQAQNVQKTFYRYDVSPSTIAALLNITELQIAYYSVYRADGYPIKFEMDNRLLQNQHTFLLRNTFGAQESFTTTGDDISERKWTRTFGSIGGKQTLTDRNLSNLYTVNTGYLDRRMVGVLEDMHQSKTLYLVDEFGLHEIQIQEESFKVTSRKDEVINVEFKYKYSSNNELQYRRNVSSFSRIFDPSFDPTFN